MMFLGIRWWWAFYPVCIRRNTGQAGFIGFTTIPISFKNNSTSVSFESCVIDNCLLDAHVLNQLRWGIAKDRREVFPEACQSGTLGAHLTANGMHDEIGDLNSRFVHRLWNEIMINRDAHRTAKVFNVGLVVRANVTFG
ncbi:MAG: hypothetical protein A2Z95_08855 [Gallionellales bacterium GWA2_60_18]|nr:MAG: hypothetical protein A2Z95_08855 [Gallionellales bacterium GWA2_60_18]